MVQKSWWQWLKNILSCLPDSALNMIMNTMILFPVPKLPSCSIMSCKNYFLYALTIFLFFSFLYLAFDAWEKFNQDRISTNVMDLKVKNFLYPSLTICPEKAFKSSLQIPYHGTFDELKSFYLTHVRSIKETFFFVNQRTWSWSGHKCITGPVSEDPGRPCIFPFTHENVSYDKCLMPGRWVVWHHIINMNELFNC